MTSEGNDPSPISSTTAFYSIDDSSPQQVDTPRTPPVLSKWARERAALEASKVELKRAVQRQQLVDESVGNLLRRLKQLPGAGESSGSDSCEPITRRFSEGQTTSVKAFVSCTAYRVDLRAAFATCVCGAPQVAHSEAARIAESGPLSSRLSRRVLTESVPEIPPPLESLDVGWSNDGESDRMIKAAALPPSEAFAAETATESASADPWRGWTIQTTRDGKLFYHHAATNTSQWPMPRELSFVLGEWLPAPGEAYWRNELLNVSSLKDPRHTTSLFQAALDGNFFFLQLYIEAGGCIDAVDASGRTSLHYNCAMGFAQAVIFLLQRGASLSMRDKGGSTPLHWACRYGHTTIVRILLQAEAADLNVQNNVGDTALHEAAALGRLKALQLLVKARADATLKNRENRTPAEVAALGQASDAEALLLRAAARAAATTAAKAAVTAAPAASIGSADATLHVKEAATLEEDDEPSLAVAVFRVARPLIQGTVRPLYGGALGVLSGARCAVARAFGRLGALGGALDGTALRSLRGASARWAISPRVAEHKTFVGQNDVHHVGKYPCDGGDGADDEEDDESAEDEQAASDPEGTDSDSPVAKDAGLPFAHPRNAHASATPDL